MARHLIGLFSTRGGILVEHSEISVSQIYPLKIHIFSVVPNLRYWSSVLSGFRITLQLLRGSLWPCCTTADSDSQPCKTSCVACCRSPLSACSDASPKGRLLWCSARNFEFRALVEPYPPSVNLQGWNSGRWFEFFSLSENRIGVGRTTTSLQSWSWTRWPTGTSSGRRPPSRFRMQLTDI